MGWQGLGLIRPTIQWQSYEQPVLEVETFRIIQNWGSRHPRGPAILGQYFAAPDPGGRAGYRKIWASTREPQIITFRMPAGFREAGYTLFYLQIKLSNYWAHDFDAINSWTVYIQAFYP